MSKAILYRRRGRRHQAGSALGRDVRLPRVMVGQLVRELSHAQIINGPQPAGTSADLQDPADPAKLYFIPGISTPGGPDILA